MCKTQESKYLFKKEILTEAAKQLKANSPVTLGQAVYNVAQEKYPKVVKLMILNCYYNDDNGYIDQFLTELYCLIHLNINLTNE